MLSLLLLFPFASAATTTSAPANIPIKHIFIIMQENHTFDNYFGYYPGVTNGLANATAQRWPNGTVVAPFEINSSTIASSPTLLCHFQHCARAAYNNGKMNGFLQAENSSITMGYFNPKLIADYWDYASRYVLLDNLYSSFMGPSLPNHVYLIAGTSGGWTNDSTNAVFNFPTITQELDAANVSWVYYAGDHYGVNGWNPLPGDIPYLATHPQLQGLKESVNFPADILKPNFPSVAWIMPETDQISEHPPYNVTAGMLSVVSEVNDIMQSPYWSSSMIFVTWDDYGGWYDNAVPPQVDQYGYGFRVPGLIISPYAKTGYIDNTVLEFSSTLKFIETVFHLPSLGTRDATANNILQAFNFNQAPQAPMILPGPLAAQTSSPFLPNHYPITYTNGTAYTPPPAAPPGAQTPADASLEYAAIEVSAVVVLMVVVVGVVWVSKRRSPPGARAASPAARRARWRRRASREPTMGDLAVSPAEPPAEPALG
ncbi:MAG: hypothetical protein JRN58_10360 [Nitrososphaerota archaeon]|nr:hypothetical protein [Nitrososphaerota archaeon]MDG6979468.1 hypothetical protein [Nitrososphaerota archaeon]